VLDEDSRAPRGASNLEPMYGRLWSTVRTNEMYEMRSVLRSDRGNMLFKFSTSSERKLKVKVIQEMRIGLYRDERRRVQANAELVNIVRRVILAEKSVSFGRGSYFSETAFSQPR